MRIAGDICVLCKLPAPPLLPLLRSRLQADLLAVVLLTPGREWSLTELADRAGSSLSSAQREMARAASTASSASARAPNSARASRARNVNPYRAAPGNLQT